MKLALMALGALGRRSHRFCFCSLHRLHLVKGTKQDENKYTDIIFVKDFGNAEEIFVASPTYTYAVLAVKEYWRTW